MTTVRQRRGEGRDNLGMLLGKVVARDPSDKRRGAELRDLGPAGLAARRQFLSLPKLHSIL
jgi:hypothetical protein